MKFIDKTIEWLSPTMALKREVNRAKLSALRKATNSGYSNNGASRRKNSMKGWNSDSKSPQEDIGQNLAVLRERSRDLYMGGGLATGAIKKNQSNIVGSGLTLKCQLNYRLLGITAEQAKEWEDRTEFEFNLWASSKIDNTGLNDFYDAQRIMLTGWLLNGDSLAVMKYADTAERLNPYRMRLHLIEGDRLNNPNHTQGYSPILGTEGFSLSEYVELSDGRAIRNGVETDPNGKVIAYWISNKHPNSTIPQGHITQWARVEAQNPVSGLPNVLFVMDAERAEQYRGVPYLAPVIEQVKQMDRYAEAEIAAAIINSFFAAFITRKEGAKNEIPFTNPIPESEQLKLSPEERLSSYELGPGTINMLAEGEEVTFGDPTHPNAGFDSFTKVMAQLAGAALDMPYEVLLSVFNSSYSASRAALLQAWRSFRDRRDWFSHDFCQPTYETWLFEAVATGRIKAPGFFSDPVMRKLWSQAIWIGPSPGQIDPEKEVDAAVKRINNGFSTHERETAELTGMDWDSNIDVLTREWEARRNLPQAHIPGMKGGDKQNAKTD
ncbi:MULTISPECIES: phage portal protein [Brevibacillus]|uniref:phage portal protein n=1 Tax=Brevibacillus TaxID=55080 RepID=UPI000D0E9ACE|nr:MULTISPECIES: phage portal protein [Brevibacillus]MED1947058.1 phage portal protein [Brevibacillus formosus]MED2000466.1 phage portal protein [Brevibacillus formosus]MED2085745.1 phage portal protein [Brevibacillus formosus]PSK13494.1 phage portal protein [Brevibacillus sp. NRRL NRS-603]